MRHVYLPDNYHVYTYSPLGVGQTNAGKLPVGPMHDIGHRLRVTQAEA